MEFKSRITIKEEEKIMVEELSAWPLKFNRQGRNE